MILAENTTRSAKNGVQGQSLFRCNSSISRFTLRVIVSLITIFSQYILTSRQLYLGRSASKQYLREIIDYLSQVVLLFVPPPIVEFVLCSECCYQRRNIVDGETRNSAICHEDKIGEIRVQAISLTYKYLIPRNESMKLFQECI